MRYLGQQPPTFDGSSQYSFGKGKGNSCVASIIGDDVEDKKSLVEDCNDKSHDSEDEFKMLLEKKNVGLSPRNFSPHRDNRNEQIKSSLFEQAQQQTQKMCSALSPQPKYETEVSKDLKQCEEKYPKSNLSYSPEVPTKCQPSPKVPTPKPINLEEVRQVCPQEVSVSRQQSKVSSAYDGCVQPQSFTHSRQVSKSTDRDDCRSVLSIATTNNPLKRWQIRDDLPHPSAKVWEFLDPNGRPQGPCNFYLNDETPQKINKIQTNVVAKNVLLPSNTNFSFFDFHQFHQSTILLKF